MPFVFVDSTGIRNPVDQFKEDHNAPPVKKAIETRSEQNRKLVPGDYSPYDPVGSFTHLLNQAQLTQERGFKGAITVSKDLKIKDVMSTQIESLDAHATIKAAFELFDRFNFRHIPVTTYQDQLIGILSERDIIRQLYHYPPENWQAFYQIPLADFMISPVLSVTHSASVQEVADLMSYHDIGCLPVVEYENLNDIPILKGIVTKSDLYSLLIEAESV